MSSADQIQVALDALRLLVNEGRASLRLFNEPDWPTSVEALFESIDAAGSKHADGVRPDFVEDYANITMLLTQLEWPADDREQEDRDQRIMTLRGIVGNIRIDIDRLLHIAGPMILPSGNMQEALPIGTTMIIKNRHVSLISAIEQRLLRIEKAILNEMVLQAGADRNSQSRLIEYFMRAIRTDISIAKASLRVGPSVDLGILERASISMIDVTGRMAATVRSSFSQASRELKKAINVIREPVRRFIIGVRTMLRFVLRENTSYRHPSDSDVPEYVPLAGEFLRLKREKLGLSLEDVASSSRVGLQFLRAIEQGNFEPFSAEHYVIGFGKSFAKAVNESPDEVAKMLRKDLAASRFRPQSRLKDVHWSGGPDSYEHIFWGRPLDLKPYPRSDRQTSSKDESQKD